MINVPIILRLEFGCIFIIAYISFIYYTVKRKKTTQYHLFTALVASTLLNLIFDAITVYTVNNLTTVPPLLNRICHVIFVSTIMICVVISYVYLSVLARPEFPNKIRLINISPVLLALILAWFLPVEYTQTPYGNYSSGALTILCYIVLTMYLAATFVLAVISWKKLDAKKRKAIFLSLAGQIIVSVIQFFIPYSLITSIGLTLITLSFFITVESPDIQLVEKLKAEKERADYANEVKSEFLRNMSHEIRTPLNTLIGMDEMILKESNQRQIVEYAQDIKTSANHLHSIIGDILDFSKIESGKMELNPDEYDVRDVIRHEYALFSNMVQGEKLTLKFDMDENIPCRLFGDHMRIKQILTNLITNAVKYTKEGEVVFSASLLSVADGKAKIRFTVSDTGIGIKQEDISKLFEAFRRIDEKKHRSIGGTGLGLSIVNQLMKLMDTKLEIESEVGKGSSFSFTLEQEVIDCSPIGDFESIIDSRPETSDERVSLTAKNVTILLVDDNVMNLKVARNYLKDTGIEIDEAMDGYQCSELVRTKKYDLIFMDHMMPGMDGVETFEFIKNMPDNMSFDTPVVMLTANAVAGVKEKFLNYGFAEYLVKPINSIDFYNVIAKLLPDKVSHETVADEREFTDLPMVDGMDRDFAKIHFDDQNQLLDAIRTFIELSEMEISILNELYSESFNEQSIKEYRTKVHGMKNSAAIIGLIPLAGMAKVLEDAADSFDTDTIKRLHPVFVKKWCEMDGRLSIFKEEDKEEKLSASENQDMIDALLRDLYNFAKDVDLCSLDDTISLINKYEFEGEQAELIRNVNAAVQMFDIDTIQQLLKAYDS